MDDPALVEALAAIEHEQWMAWAKSLVGSEPLSPERVLRWHDLMVPYADLPDEMKEHDRVWARRVCAALAKWEASK